ncbi:MAG: putative photosynthetic complex assembly protein PuhE [Pseudomonadota bacterium]
MTALSPALLAVLAALFLWWFSTGALIWLARMGAAMGGLAGKVTVLAGALALLVASLGGSAALGGATTVEAAYLSFLCGLGAWGFVELTFLTGLIAGPVTRPCPPGARGIRRFGLALGTLLWHELAILLVGALLLAMVWGAPNQTGAWSFALLMGLRISAKLNLFLGVPYPPTAMLPRPLAHLESYFRVRPFTALLPLTITAATALATLVAWRAASPELDAFHATAYALFWTLLVLGIAEHWFLILPVRESALWRWFLERDASAAPRASDAFTKPGDHAAADSRGKASGTGVIANRRAYVPGVGGDASNEKGGTASPKPA